MAPIVPPNKANNKRVFSDIRLGDDLKTALNLSIPYTMIVTILIIIVTTLM